MPRDEVFEFLTDAPTSAECGILNNGLNRTRSHLSQRPAQSADWIFLTCPGTGSLPFRIMSARSQAVSMAREWRFPPPEAIHCSSLTRPRAPVIKQQSINAVCGIASGGEGFLTTSLSGKIGRRKHPLHWDNHSAGIPHYPPSM